MHIITITNFNLQTLFNFTQTVISNWKSFLTAAVVVLVLLTLLKLKEKSFRSWVERSSYMRVFDKPLDARKRSGENAYVQFLRSLLTDNKPNVNSTLNNTHFTYDARVKGMPDGAVQFKLIEHYLGNLTYGGSSFLAVQEPHNVCRVTDHFNGHYTGICDPLPFAACSQLTVVLQSLRYMLYTKAVNPLQKVVFQKEVCRSNASASDLLKYRRNRVITWSAENIDRTYITHHYGIPVGHVMNHSTICRKLLEKYDHVTMIGASHTRYQFDYVLEYCYSYEGAPVDFIRKHSSLKLDDIDYKAAHFSADFPRIIRQQLTEFNYTATSLIILQVGSHDANSSPLELFVPKIQQFAEAIRMLCEAEVGTIVVIGAPPFPDHERNLKARNWRNNYSIAALNYMVATEVMKLMVGCTSIYYL